MSDAETHVRALLAAHDASTTTFEHKASAGIFPLCRDPNTGVTFLLLGLTKGQKFQTMHGFIDHGETMAQGASREAWEESRGVLSQSAVWRCLTLPAGVACSPVGSGNVAVINLGNFDSERRARLCHSFRRTKTWSRSSAECVGLAFFPLSTIFSLTTTQSQRNTGAASGANADDRNSKRSADEPIVLNTDTDTGLPQVLRGSVAQSLCRRGFWQNPVLQAALAGQPLPIASLDELPQLSEDVLEKLPYKRAPARRPAAAQAAAGEENE